MFKWLRKKKKSFGLDNNDLFEISNDVVLGHTKGFTINGVKWELHSRDFVPAKISRQILNGVLNGDNWYLDWKMDGEY